MFYLINKPIGISSFFAISKLRKILNIKKVGHTGTLDPLASGLLLVATGNSTKLISYLDKARKTYIFSFNLDGYTESGDLGTPIHYLDNKLIEETQKTITKDKIKNLIESKFLGKITQIPPKYSAIKVNGKRAYSLARDGKEVQIPERIVEIFDYKLLDYNFPTVTLEMTVSAGTYIRTIAEDIGKELGLNAYTITLHRSKIGDLDESKSVDIENLKQTDSIPYSHLFPDFKEIILDPENISKISSGIILENKFSLTEGQKYFIKNETLDYISLIEVKNNELFIIANKIS
ncbi:tRNA pseudouridine(55) synthase TruB [Candidatus Gracilibacteria bacterium]|nr:tRNA pseudouridine(55) synthase TruB [Candidatus Gracilibacteria bacterium]